MATEALNELPETTSLPEPTQLKVDAEGWARGATTRLGDDYAKIVRALQALDGALETLQGTLPAPSGTRLVFDQDAAPTGWTRDTAAALNDRVLRIVTGARAHGGSWTISGLTVQGHTLTIAEMPGHNHNYNDAFAGAGIGGNVTGGGNQGNPAGLTGVAGGDSAHTHGLSADGNWRPLHRDMIVASKD